MKDAGSMLKGDSCKYCCHCTLNINVGAFLSVRLHELNGGIIQGETNRGWRGMVKQNCRKGSCLLCGKSKSGGYKY